MSATLILSLIGAYFGLLYIISLITSRKADNATFFTGGKSSPWYLVAFGMIGASLSGVTFMSVPGEVAGKHFFYLQVVLGYILGYLVISFVLMPIYYRLNLTSIYGYFEGRMGKVSYKTAAAFFLLSRTIGASFRLFLVAIVLDEFVFSAWGIPFWGTVVISIALIWLYTFRGGIKTVVWTDTLQTLFMLLAAGLAIWAIKDELGWSFGRMVDELQKSDYTQVFNWDKTSGTYFWKQFISGAFITIVMTGMDQDMMQKNLTCRSLKDAQKNMTTLSIVIVFVNIGFLVLGALLYFYGQESVTAIWNQGKLALWDAQKLCFEDVGPGDRIFPFLAMKVLPPSVGILFILGLIAAAYSSADSALTALTTSVCVDFLDFEKKENEDKKRRTRMLVHILVSVGVILTIMLFKLINDQSVITAIFKIAGYTYGPLLGMFAYGILTRLKVWDQAMPIACIIAPVVSYLLETWMDGWFGFSILLVNGGITFLLIWVLSLVKPPKKAEREWIQVNP